MSTHRWQLIGTTAAGRRKWRCTRCRTIVVPPANHQEWLARFNQRFPCGSPGVARLALRYTKAVARWIAAGRPVRSDSRVQEIFETLCQPCEHFDAEHQSCRLCGCRIRKSGLAFANKLRMATERCPMRPPKWTEEIPQE